MKRTIDREAAFDIIEGKVANGKPVYTAIKETSKEYAVASKTTGKPITFYGLQSAYRLRGGTQEPKKETTPSVRDSSTAQFILRNKLLSSDLKVQLLQDLV